MKTKIKQYLIYIGDEFVYGGHLLSLGGVSIAFVASVLLGIQATPGFFLIIYLAFQAIYLFNRYKEFPGDYLTNPERTRHLNGSYAKIPWAVFFCLLIFFAILIYFGKIPALIFSSFTVSLGFLYSISLKKITGRVPGFKGIFVSVCWSTLVVFLILYYDQPLSWPVILLTVFVFLRWMVNTTVFDVKDLADDQRKKLRTLAVVLGKEKLLVFLKAVTIVSILPVVLGVCFKILPPASLILLFTVPYAFYYLKRVRQEKPNSFTYNVLIDGEFILWSVFVMMGYYIYGNT